MDKHLAIIKYKTDSIYNEAGYSILEKDVMQDLPDYFITKYFHRLKPIKSTTYLYFKMYIMHNIDFETIQAVLLEAFCKEGLFYKLQLV